MAALAELTAASSTVLRDGRLTTVPSAELVPGDLLVLAEGDAVGADARLLSAAALRVQEASLTGESEAELKDPAVLAAPAVLGDRTDMVYRGTAVAQGVGRAVVTGTGPATEMGAIADMLERTRAEETPLQKEIAAVSRSLGLLVVAVAVVVMVAVVLVHGVSGPGDLVTVLLLGVSLAVAAVPEGLPAILSLVLALGVRAMARRNAVLKDLHSVEALGAASVICSDQDGNAHPQRDGAHARRDRLRDGGAVGDGLRARGRCEGRVRRARPGPGGGAGGARRRARANNAQLDGSGGQWTAQGDPTEAAFLAALPKLPGAADAAAGFGRLAEVPFTSERRMMSVVDEETGTGEHRLFTKGAPDELLARCSGVLVGDAVEPLDAARRAAAAGAAEALSAEAFRVLAVAARCLPGSGEEPAAGTGVLDVPAGDGLEHDLVWLGAVGIIDPPREEAGVAVARARAAGVRTVMITGDHPATAGRIAADLGIAPPGGPVLTGAQLDALTDEELVAAARGTAVFARVAPAHKLRIVAALQADGHVVAMTGDGVNDAPALKAADIGVAMGITGTEVTKQAGRMVLGDDDYATIVAAEAPRGPDPRPGDVASGRPGRAGHGGGRAAHPGRAAAGRARGGPRVARAGPHRVLHHAGAGAAVQRPELPLRDQQRVPPAVHEPVAVGGAAARCRAAGAGGAPAAAAGGLRHASPRAGPLGAGRRRGLAGAVDGGAREAPPAGAGPGAGRGVLSGCLLSRRRPARPGTRASRRPGRCRRRCRG